MHVDCSRIELKYDEAPKVKWAKGSGGVTAKLKGIEAPAATFEVDVAHRSIKGERGRQVEPRRGWVTADTAAIDINTRKVTLEDVKGSIPVQAPEALSPRLVGSLLRGPGGSGRPGQAFVSARCGSQGSGGRFGGVSGFFQRPAFCFQC